MDCPFSYKNKIKQLFELKKLKNNIKRNKKIVWSSDDMFGFPDKILK